MSVTYASFTIERTYPKSRDVVFQAFADPAKKRRWFAERSDADHALDFRVGGTETSRSRMGDNTPMPGATLSNDTVFMDIVPNERIIMAYSMAVNDARISCSLATFAFETVASGTKLTMTEQACFFEHSDGVEMRQQGWTHILESLGKALAQ